MHPTDVMDTYKALFVQVLQSQTKVLTKENFHMMLETDDRRVGVDGCKANISFFVLMT